MDWRGRPASFCQTGRTVPWSRRLPKAAIRAAAPEWLSKTAIASRPQPSDRLPPGHRLRDFPRSAGHEPQLADIEERVENGGQQILEVDRIGGRFADIAVGAADDLAHVQASA